MTENDEFQWRRIKRALISVSDKTGIVEFAQTLRRFDVEIISTGGTATVLREAGIDVRDVSDVTGFPEMMDGRVKTLHPKIHGALLGLRDNEQHLSAMRTHDIEPIDMVVVNLYPFELTINVEGVSQKAAIEQIDIGGPAMIRSAAKNFGSVAVVVLPEQYSDVSAELKTTEGSLSLATRSRLAKEAFFRTARYDLMISSYFAKVFDSSATHEQDGTAQASRSGGECSMIFSVDSGLDGKPLSSVEDSQRPPDKVTWSIQKTLDLRYGENPHQRAALYATGKPGLASAELLSGKEMSFNNYVDADAAWQLVTDFGETTCAIIKHTNPAGVGVGTTPTQAYQKALATDPVSAFGGIVAFNRSIDADAAREIVKIFTEVVIAPDYAADALAILKGKKNLRLIRMGSVEAVQRLEYKQISGGVLVQTSDTHRLRREDLKVVTNRQPTDEEIKALMFAWTVCKHTKSNAIVYARADQTVGVGAGQMSRVDSVKIGAMRAQLPLAGSVLASDAFFPFRDGIDEAAKHGITAVIQPGGSVRDDEVISAANEHGLAMVFTGIRHFKH